MWLGEPVCVRERKVLFGSKTGGSICSNFNLASSFSQGSHLQVAWLHLATVDALKTVIKLLKSEFKSF